MTDKEKILEEVKKRVEEKFDMHCIMVDIPVPAPPVYEKENYFDVKSSEVPNKYYLYIVQPDYFTKGFTKGKNDGVAFIIGGANYVNSPRYCLSCNQKQYNMEIDQILAAELQQSKTLYCLQCVCKFLNENEDKIEFCKLTHEISTGCADKDLSHGSGTETSGSTGENKEERT